MSVACISYVGNVCADGSQPSERLSFALMMTRRQFASGSAALVSSGLIGGSGMGEPAPFSTPLAIPKLIDAASQANAVKLKVTSGLHAFIPGKPTRTYGYSAPILGPVIRLRRGDEVEICSALRSDQCKTLSPTSRGSDTDKLYGS
jgi:hypothetical protein